MRATAAIKLPCTQVHRTHVSHSLSDACRPLQAYSLAQAHSSQKSQHIPDTVTPLHLLLMMSSRGIATTAPGTPKPHLKAPCNCQWHPRPHGLSSYRVANHLVMKRLRAWVCG